VSAWLTLADFAQVHAGKLYIVGGGVNITGPGPVSMGVAVQVVVPWNDRSKRRHLVVRLCDLDHNQISVPTPVGDIQVEVAADFEVVPAPGTLQASELPFAFSFYAPNLPLAPGGYTWRLFLDDSTEEAAHATFSVRSPPSPGQPF